MSELNSRQAKPLPSALDEAEVHQQLMRRRKNKNESYEEYFYEMLVIGKKERSMMKYIITGLDDKELARSLSILNLQSTEGLLANIKCYQDTMVQSSRNEHPVVQNRSRETSISQYNSVLKCYNCEGKGPLARDCPEDKGIRCFKCSECGHKSRACPKSTRNESRVMCSRKDRLLVRQYESADMRCQR